MVLVSLYIQGFQTQRGLLEKASLLSADYTNSEVRQQETQWLLGPEAIQCGFSMKEEPWGDDFSQPFILLLKYFREEKCVYYLKC